MKRVYRLYREEGLQVRTAKRSKRAAHARVPLAGATRRNQRDGVWILRSDRLGMVAGSEFPTVVDQYTRECLCAYAESIPRRVHQK